jgi:mRNA interferase MazF
VRRGDVVLAVLQREVGKPRPVVVVQSDVINETDPTTYIVCPFTGDIAEGGPVPRIVVEPTPTNGLDRSSAIMTDKLALAGRDRLRDVIGRLDAGTMRRLDGMLAVVLGIGTAGSVELTASDIPSFLRLAQNER